MPRSAYCDPSQELSLIFLNESSLSKIKLAYDAKSPLKTYTLWEYALKNSNSFVMPSLTNLKSKIGQALEMTVKEDEEFWDIYMLLGEALFTRALSYATLQTIYDADPMSLSCSC